jgi:hypothetical protein
VRYRIKAEQEKEEAASKDCFEVRIANGRLQIVNPSLGTFPGGRHRRCRKGQEQNQMRMSLAPELQMMKRVSRHDHFGRTDNS